jgi:hypothetical protein
MLSAIFFARRRISERGSVSHLRRLASLRNCSQRLRAGLFFCRAYGAEEMRSQKSRRDAGATKGGVPMLDEDGPRYSARSPATSAGRRKRACFRAPTGFCYGNTGERRKQEQAPALHRIAGRARLECGGLPPLSRVHQRQGLKRAQQAAPLREIATARYVWKFLRKGRRISEHGVGVAAAKEWAGSETRATISFLGESRELQGLKPLLVGLGYVAPKGATHKDDLLGGVGLGGGDLAADFVEPV